MLVSLGMGIRQKHRMAGKHYNLLSKIEIQVEIQVQDDGAFLNEFFLHSQPRVNLVQTLTMRGILYLILTVV